MKKPRVMYSQVYPVVHPPDWASTPHITFGWRQAYHFLIGHAKGSMRRTNAYRAAANAVQTLHDTKGVEEFTLGQLHALLCAAATDVGWMKR
jgi:hypothetical protein